MTVAERQALMHSFRAISRRNPNAVPWSSALVWVAVVVHRFPQVFAVSVHRVVHCLTFRRVPTRVQLEAFAWIRKATGEIRAIEDSRTLTDRNRAVADACRMCGSITHAQVRVGWRYMGG